MEVDEALEVAEARRRRGRPVLDPNAKALKAKVTRTRRLKGLRSLRVHSSTFKRLDNF